MNLYRKNDVCSGLFYDPGSDSISFIHCAVPCLYQLAKQQDNTAIIHVNTHVVSCIQEAALLICFRKTAGRLLLKFD